MQLKYVLSSKTYNFSHFHNTTVITNYSCVISKKSNRTIMSYSSLYFSSCFGVPFVHGDALDLESRNPASKAVKTYSLTHQLLGNGIQPFSELLLLPAKSDQPGLLAFSIFKKLRKFFNW